MAYATLPNIAPDFSPDYQISNSVSSSRFGDGYEQSRPAGINYQSRSYAVQWSMLERTDYDTLHDFLAARQNLEPFQWQAPWDTVVRQWKCRSLSGPRPTSARFAVLQATFEEDFTP